MKLRTDFVTNSSSSSFVIWGVNINSVGTKISEEELDEKYDGSIRDYIDELTTDTPLLCGNASYESDEVWIGISPSTILHEFKDRKIGEIPKIVAEEINKLFGTKIEPDEVEYIEESSSNG